MLDPEQLEIESLYLNMSDDPEVSKVLYGFMADGLDGIINELVDSGALEATPEQIINTLINCRDELRQISEL